MPDFEKGSVDIYIHRSPHVTREDFSFLGPMVRDRRFHLYAPESDGFEDTKKEGYRLISKGDAKTYRDIIARTDPDSMSYAFFSALYASRIPLAFFDTSPEETAANPILAQFGKNTIDLQDITAESLIESMPGSLSRSAAFIEARDRTIAQNVETHLPEIITGNPRLRLLGRIGLLITIGDNHQMIDSLLTNRGFSVETNPVTTLNPREDAVVTLLRGGELTEQQILQSSAVALLRGYIWHSSTAELRKIMCDILDDVNMDDVDQIINTLRRGGTTGIHDYIKKLLETHNITGSGLVLQDPARKRPAILPKHTPEIRNGVPGIRTDIF